MGEFLKTFGLGILYTIASPFALAFFSLFLIYTFLNYIVCEVYNASTFFLGKGCSRYTKLEKHYKKMKAIEKEKEFNYTTSNEPIKEVKENVK